MSWPIGCVKLGIRLILMCKLIQFQTLVEYSPTGDGTMAAIQILAEIRRQNCAASEVLNVFEPVPQILKNVRYSGDNPMTHPKFISAIDAAQSDFNGRGRVLIRASGTEPLIRVMAEGDDLSLIETVVNQLVGVIEGLVSA